MAGDKKSVRARRENVQYTDSEEEEEEPETPPPQTKTRPTKPAPLPKKRGPLHLPKDRAALDELYHERYADYSMLFARVVQERRKNERALKGDVDEEALDVESLMALAQSYQDLHEELELIRKAAAAAA